MKYNYIYLASSWRNVYQPMVVATLRAAGVNVFDFRNPEPNYECFHWKGIDGGWQSWTPQQWREALKHPAAQKEYTVDRGGMDRADCCVLLLPCGRSAHLEAGYMADQGKPVYTLVLEKTEPELMTLLLGPPEHILCSMDELFDAMGVPK